MWVIMMAVFCIIALMLPLEGDRQHSELPQYLLLSVNQKLLAAFILGKYLSHNLHSSHLVGTAGMSLSQDEFRPGTEFCRRKEKQSVARFFTKPWL